VTWQPLVKATEAARTPPCVESTWQDGCLSRTQGIATSKRHGQRLPCYGASDLQFQRAARDSNPQPPDP
jgi:hypothetical protein